VLSTGRSGSTLLELALASHPDIATVGELQLLPHFMRDPSSTCSCGRSLATCPYWSTALGPGDVVPPDPFRETVDAGRVVRPRWLTSVVTGRVGHRARARATDYARPTATVVETAAQQLGASYVVDASKDVYRLHLLAAAGIDLRVVLLVRDPRGFANSMLAGSSRTTRRVMRYATRWLVQNLLFECAARPMLRSGSALRIRYEDLAGDPDRTLQLLGRWLGADPTRFDVAGLHTHLHHAIGGNPMRDRREPIAVDDRWRTALSPSERRITWFVDGPLARRYGYRGRPT
jgi:hypothetical protein